ncbi:hypothetical protein ABZS66_51065 [Dactylosporangium sp. NPDC005572]|uniref:hypothetical protein n=1 Tax=Dactylosporangium sp. NPDC005572 TaxID=3156889 RepID=UPI0033AFBBD5
MASWLQPERDDRAAPGWYSRPIAAGAALLAVAVAGIVLADRPGGPELTMFRVGAVLAVLLLGALPRVAISAGGLAAADFRVRSANEDPAEVARRLRAAGRAFGWLAASAAVAGASWAGWLAVHGTPVDRVLVVLVGICLVVRSRLFDQGWAGAVPAVAGAVIVVVAVVRMVTDPGPLPGLLPTVAGVVTGAVLGTAQTLMSRHGPGRRRLLRWLEVTAVVAMVCAAAVSVGLVEAARAIVG